MHTADELAPGSVFGAYRIDRLLGRGGMGTVYAAERLEDGRTIALKLLGSALASEADRERFLREGRTAASINHPHTVYVYRTEEIDGTPAIAMELVDGGTLEGKVAAHGPLSEEEAIRDILQVIDGLAAAERLGILHRDVKPSNCFVARSGEVKVGDFGLSRPVDQADEMRLTQSGLFVGTPVFSSPEQLLGEKLDVRTDIYAVGVTLYFLLTGKLPFAADSAPRLMVQVLAGEWQPIATHRPGITPALDLVVRRCLTRRREERFTDYASLRTALLAALPSTATPAPLGRRFAAGVVDCFILAVVGYPIYLSIESARRAASLPEISSLAEAAVSFPLIVLFFAVMEGRFGWSPGKRIAGLRVEGERGGLPGFWRGAVRGVALSLILHADAILLPQSLRDADDGGLFTFAADLAMMALLFIGARRANGFAAVHDRLTRTRVVRRNAAGEVTAASAVPGESSFIVPPDAPHLGPFVVTGTLPSPQRVELAVDLTLQRRLWLVHAPMGAPPLSDEERAVVRRGAARWIFGRRSASEAWDAYAAVPGVPLRERLTSRATWGEVHGWLTDIVDELIARRETGSASALSVDHVWISTEGRAVILPFVVGDDDDGARPSGDLLADLSALLKSAVAAGALRPAVWPHRAHAVMAALGTESPDLTTVRRALARGGDTPNEMSRRRRVALWGALTSFHLFVVIFGGAYVATRMLPGAERLQPLLRYVKRSAAQETSDLESRRLAGTYIAAHFTPIIRHAQRDDIMGINDDEWRIADSLLVAESGASAEQRQAAERLVDGRWGGYPPGYVPYWIVVVLTFLSASFLILGALSLIAALLARRGSVLRLLGLEVVTAEGTRAGRVRAILRTLVAWLPGAMLTFLAVVLTSRWTARGSIVLAGLLVLAVLAVVTTWLTPERGLAERVTGTRVVPE